MKNKEKNLIIILGVLCITLVIIAVVIVSFCTISDKRRYIDELLAHGVISFINSKNKGIFEEALS